MSGRLPLVTKALLPHTQPSTILFRAHTIIIIGPLGHNSVRNTSPALVVRGETANVTRSIMHTFSPEKVCGIRWENLPFFMTNQACTPTPLDPLALWPLESNCPAILQRCLRRPEQQQLAGGHLSPFRARASDPKKLIDDGLVDNLGLQALECGDFNDLD